MHLDLYDMSLTGSIPPEFGRLHDLRTMILARNELTGGIPPEFGQLKKLRRLQLDNNDLTGVVPPELARLPVLGRLWLGNNRLNSSVSLTLFGSVVNDLADLTYCVPPSEMNSGLLDDCTRLLSMRGVLDEDNVLKLGQGVAGR